MVVEKKSGKIRLFVELCEPNKSIVMDSFLLQALGSAKFFSKIDLAATYHQVPLVIEGET